VTDNYWKEGIALPYRHLIGDGFWEIVKRGDVVDSAFLPASPSLGILESLFDGARLTADLWELLQDPAARSALRTVLLLKYSPQHHNALLPHDLTDPLDDEAERLILAAEAPFRVTRPKEEVNAANPDGAYVRNAAFRRVVKNLYDARCAVCGIDVRSGSNSSGLIEAAHVVPFSVSHNDDPRNGMALCRNHHLGFDKGWFTVSDSYKLIVSPRLKQKLMYVQTGNSLRLPDNPKYAPAPEALE